MLILGGDSGSGGRKGAPCFTGDKLVVSRLAEDLMEEKDTKELEFRKESP